jgi:hypothetical protein
MITQLIRFMRSSSDIKSVVAEMDSRGGREATHGTTGRFVTTVIGGLTARL